MFRIRNAIERWCGGSDLISGDFHVSFAHSETLCAFEDAVSQILACGLSHTIVSLYWLVTIYDFRNCSYSELYSIHGWSKLSRPRPLFVIPGRP